MAVTEIASGFATSLEICFSQRGWGAYFIAELTLLREAIIRLPWGKAEIIELL